MTLEMKKSRDHDPRDGWYLITPEQAKEIFENRFRNRPFRQVWVDRLYAEITDGTFRPNGETVIFDEFGRMIDGQHRMVACMTSGKPIEVYCVFGIPNKYFPSLGQTRLRTGGDLASILKFANATTVSAVVKLSLQYAEGTLITAGLRHFPQARMQNYMERNRDRINAAVSATVKFKDDVARLLPISQVAFTYYMTDEMAESKSQQKLRSTATGDDHSGRA